MELPYKRMRPAMNEEGFTIVELLVAVVILVFVSIALLQTAIVNIEFNAKNAIRDEGVRVAREKLNQMRNVPLADIEVPVTQRVMVIGAGVHKKLSLLPR